ncbi:MAG TPA: creatininase family protein [Acidobacteriota bacterium]|nr:creatininase family protein [Acidobacteriota bacterium]
MQIKRSLMTTFVVFSLTFLTTKSSVSQEGAGAPEALKVKWEELTSPDFVRAVAKSGGTCVIPLGIIEKHGPHLPLGTDLLDSREVSVRAALKEYAIVFPPYYFGQIFEARHQPGTVAYSQKLMWEMLQETCDELSRNGIKKIILMNGHGGNNNFLPFFCQSQLAGRKDYAVFLFQPPRDPDFEAQVKKMRKTTLEAHAGEVETSSVMAHRPDLVKLNEAGSQSGENQKRLTNIPGLYTGIWWYAAYPNHYAGDGSAGSAQLGEFVIEHQATLLAKAIKEVKEDQNTLELQKRFFSQADSPLNTKPEK